MSNSDIRDSITKTIDGLDATLRDISLKIHDDPELGNREFHAYELLTQFLKEEGFNITYEAAGLKTAFIAEFSNGPGRRVGFCSEYDALPGVGHACGHNLIAIAGLACATATKRLLQENKIQGTVVLFGTPAEESTSGKAVLVKSGEFNKRADIGMMVHPFADDSLYIRMLALDTLEVEFFGKQSHAGMAPWNGINAVDAIMQGFDNIAMLRQQILPTDRMHGIITDGGEAANVIPAHSAARFYARSVTRDQLAVLKVKMENCFKAAAKATGCTYKISWAPNGPVEDLFMNTPLAEYFKVLMEEQGVHYLSRTEEEQIIGASTDMGNFSYALPCIHPSYGIDTTATNHTKEFAAAASTQKAHENTLRAAKCLTLTAAHVYISDAFYEAAVADFKKGKPQ